MEPDGGRSAGGQARLYECGSTQHAAHLGGGGQDSNRETAGPSRMPRRDAAEPAGAFHDWANLNLAKRRLCDALGTSLGSAAHCCAISVARVRATIPRSNRPLARRATFGAAKSCSLVIFTIRPPTAKVTATQIKPADRGLLVALLTESKPRPLRGTFLSPEHGRQYGQSPKRHRLAHRRSPLSGTLENARGSGSRAFPGQSTETESSLIARSSARSQPLKIENGNRLHDDI